MFKLKPPSKKEKRLSSHNYTLLVRVLLVIVDVVVIVIIILWIKTRTFLMIGKRSTTELHRESNTSHFYF
jgi:hypothetical protein